MTNRLGWPKSRPIINSDRTPGGILKERTERLQRKLEELSQCSGDGLLERYALPSPPLPKGFYWRLRWIAARALDVLERLRLKPAHPWPAALRHAPGHTASQPLLIWAIGTDRDTLRRACTGFAEHPIAGFAPVLVTDVADFAFFSRLGWLVEYVPTLAGEGEAYEQRKVKLLARLYRGAPVLPVAAGLDIAANREEIRRWVLRSA